MVTLPWEGIPWAILPPYRHEQFTTFRSKGWKQAWCVSANLWTQGSTHQYHRAFLEKKKKLQNEKKEKGGALRNVKYDTWTRNGLRNKILICVIASWIQPFPTLYPACSSEWTLHSIWHCWLPANHFNGVQTKISSLIIIMALNMNYGRGISTVAMVSNYKWFVLEVENLPNLSC